jgi:hypothetical protein
MDDRTMTFETLAVMAILDSYGTSSAIEAGEYRLMMID